MASNISLTYWMPLLLIPFISYLPRFCPEMIVIYSGIVLILFIYTQFNNINKLCLILLVSILSIYDPLLLLFNIILLRDNIFEDNISKFIIISISVFVIIDIITLPLFLGAIYFWGIPFIVFVSMTITLFIRKKSKESIILTCLLAILASFIFQVLHTYFNNGHHYKFSNDKNISENFLKNSTTNGNYSESIANIYTKDDKITILLFSEPSGTENIIKKDYSVGNFYLYGEHDNYQEFIGDNSDFNDSSTQQKSPWAFNRPTMVRNLWSASLNDPFYCSNIGTTIKKTYNLIPLAWKYNLIGIPEITIGKKIYSNKSIHFIGDSDCVVSFLASYNSKFLNALYNQNNINEILICIFIFTCIFLYKIKKYKFSMCAIAFIPLIGFIDLVEDRNIYDISIKFIGIPITTPHVDNSSDKIINEIVKTGKTVTLNNGQSKNLIYVVGNNENICLDSIENEKNYIFFLLPNSKLNIGQSKYSAKDIPLGTVRNHEFTILDSRRLYINDVDSGGSAYRQGNITIIATNSPQRTIDIIQALK